MRKYKSRNYINVVNNLKNLNLNSAYKKISDLKNDNNTNCNDVDKRRHDGRCQKGCEEKGYPI